MKSGDGKDGMWKYQGGVEKMAGVKTSSADEQDCSRPVGIPLLSLTEMMDHTPFV